MNAPLNPPLQALRLMDHIAAATARIAPSWPLDQFIAVNPYWGWVQQPIREAAATLGTLAGTRLTASRETFRAAWTAGQLQPAHLRAACQAASQKDPSAAASVTDAALTTALGMAAAPLQRLPLVTDLLDRGAPPRPGQRWTDVVTHQISQHCAAFFDEHQATWGMNTSLGLFKSWCEHLVTDRGLTWRLGHRWLAQQLTSFPATPTELITRVLSALNIPEQGRVAYLSAALMSVQGWSAHCAYLRWQARLQGEDNDAIVHLLAIRLGWEWLLHQDTAPGALPADWSSRWGEVEAAVDALQHAQNEDWLLQHATEIAYQQSLVAGLRDRPSQVSANQPSVQAIFCIDVRSEVFRRALESVSPAVHTCGFAGFFGLPIAYSPIGSSLGRPQLPGLLAPTHEVSQSCEKGLGEVLVKQRHNALQWRQRWSEFRASPASAFSFVEGLGLTYGAKLMTSSLPSTQGLTRWEDAGLSSQAAAALHPCLPLAQENPKAAATMAQGILRAMGLVRDFAPLILLVGHGSQSANNPHAAGLDCGACCGQTGEVNARVLAQVLNAPAVRDHLRILGIDIPTSSHFVPALHNTTTDEVLLYDVPSVPKALKAELASLQTWLESAGDLARAERAPGLGLAALTTQPKALKRELLARANDWAQLRPEWGLANNAAFIVAPRARTRHLNLAGRCFLHDYDVTLDPDLRVLTLIMTAPMVVTHWINMQYHASTVDNGRYGSGNKVLHNVVGGHCGVFEGNGGDLRIGLPLQSVHDGQAWRHTPLRLSVFIEAPREAIEKVMAQQEIVRHLVHNEWLHLLRIDPQEPLIERWEHGEWRLA